MSHLQEIATRFQVQLEGLKVSNAREYNQISRELEKIFREEVGDREITDLTPAQLAVLIRDIRDLQTNVINDFVDELIEALKEVARYSYEFEAGALVAGSVATEVADKVSMNALWKNVMEHPLSVDGGLPQSWIEKLTSVQRLATEGLIRRAYAEGMSNRDVIQAYRGTRTLRFTDGIVAKVGRSNETVIRTVMQHVTSVARMKVWEDNSDIVKGYRWVSTLDSRTGATCRGLDSEEFEVGKGPLPPIHPNCRSTTVAILAPEFEEARSDFTRSSEKGPVPQTTSYYEWLKKQSKEFQDSVLGESRGKLFRDSGMTVEEFTRLQLSRYFKPLTLKEMRLLKPLAFKRAGI